VLRTPGGLEVVYPDHVPCLSSHPENKLRTAFLGVAAGVEVMSAVRAGSYLSCNVLLHLSFHRGFRAIGSTYALVYRNSPALRGRYPQKARLLVVSYCHWTVELYSPSCTMAAISGRAPPIPKALILFEDCRNTRRFAEALRQWRGLECA
jgi:hypothetical protein